ncbi:hypothetical protein HDU79_008753 [Rhizoclosmatium sp. JEL0117]|nr:hypothetical protein HDU79_008753 [Rhizoclosmatium sp. JEL0117]
MATAPSRSPLGRIFWPALKKSVIVEAKPTHSLELENRAKFQASLSREHQLFLENRLLKETHNAEIILQMTLTRQTALNLELMEQNIKMEKGRADELEKKLRTTLKENEALGEELAAAKASFQITLYKTQTAHQMEQDLQATTHKMALQNLMENSRTEFKRFVQDCLVFQKEQARNDIPSYPMRFCTLGTDMEEIVQAAPEMSDVVAEKIMLSRRTDPTRFGNYRFQKKLGEGGTATVNLYKHSRSNKFVAIKKVSEAVLMDFAMEVEVMSIAKHPNLLPLLGLNFKVSGSGFLTVAGEIVMDVVEFGLHGLMDRPKVSFLWIQSLAFQLLDVVQYLHDVLGVVHRDIKPENIRLTKGGILKLVDFGAAVFMKKGQESRVQGLTRWCGTPDHSAPEVFQRRQYGSSVDIYSVGTILEYLQWIMDEAVPRVYRNILNELVNVCKNENPSLRPNAEEAMMHYLFAGVDLSEPERYRPIRDYFAKPCFPPSYNH